MTATLLPAEPVVQPVTRETFKSDAHFLDHIVRQAMRAAGAGVSANKMRGYRQLATYAEKKHRKATGTGKVPHARADHPRNRLFAKLAAFAERNRQEPTP